MGSNPIRVTTFIACSRDENPIMGSSKRCIVRISFAVSNEVRVSHTGHHFHCLQQNENSNICTIYSLWAHRLWIIESH